MAAVTNTPSSPPGLDCPDNDTLQRFLAGRLTEAEAEAVEQHLQGCPLCLDRLAELSAQDRELGEVHTRATLEAGDDPGTVTALIQRLCQSTAVRAAGLSTSGNRDTPLDAGGHAGRCEPPPAPTQLGRYCVRRLLGAGGMGAVYLADDPELGRAVAVKVPQFAGSPDAQAMARQRFLREAHAAAAIRHPHVCPIYDVGEQDGLPYVVMAFIEGCSLAEWLRGQGNSADPRAAVALAAQVAEGLVAVHDAGLIHRDLKPSNILLDGAGNAFLSDFGLARRQDDADRLTAPGALVGTLGYMAPEQADGTGASGPVTPRTDVYSLGVMLYEMLTRRLPFEARDYLRLLYCIVHDTPPPPRQLRPDLDPRVEAICLKAMARQVEDRYASMAELAQALTRYLQAHPQPPPPPLAPAANTVPLPAPPRPPRPRKFWVASAAVAVLLLLGVLLYVKTNQENKEEPRPPAKAKGAEEPRMLKKSPRPGVPLIERAHMDDTVRAVAFSPEGTVLATAGGKSIRLWDVATGKRQDRIPHDAEVHCLAFSPEGKTLASAGTDRAITLWDVATGERKRSIPEVSTETVVWLAFAPHGRSLVTVGYEQTLPVLWEVATGKQVASLEGHTSPVNAAAFSPDGKTVATVSDDRTVRLWDAATGKAKDTLRAHDKAVRCLAFSPDGKKLATGSDDRTIVVWDVSTATVIKPELQDDSAVVFVGWTADGRIVSKNFFDGVKLWDPAVNKPVVIRKPYDGILVTSGKLYDAYTGLPSDGRTLAFRHCYWGRDIHLLDLSEYLDAPK
jgi:WD40 repeat protein/serine/threonine protein kinase